MARPSVRPSRRNVQALALSGFEQIAPLASHDAPAARARNLVALPKLRGIAIGSSCASLSSSPASSAAASVAIHTSRGLPSRGDLDKDSATLIGAQQRGRPILS